MLRKALITTTSVLSLGVAAAQAEQVQGQLMGLPFSVDTEYLRSWSNNAVKAAAAHQRGYTGAGQTVAVFDSGIDANHPEFAGRLATGFDAVRGRVGTPRDVQGHGTFVAGVIAAARDGVGMQGIAYDARILAVRIANSTGSITLSDSALAGGIQYARTRAKIQNHSWNSSATIFDVSRASFESAYAQSIAQWRTSVNTNDNVVVWAAGNEGKSEVGLYGALPVWFSDLRSGWVVVAATDSSGQIAGYSNRCGVAAAWCISAPGTALFSTTVGGGYGNNSGTSFAAPTVSGGVALIRQMWPFLQNSDVLGILFSTANKSGIYANSAVYGQGFLDLDAATRPVGTTSIAVGPTVETTVATSGTLTATSAAFGASLGSLGSLTNVMVLDSYKRDFYVPAGSFVAPAFMPYDMERNIRNIGGAMLALEQENGVRYAVAADQGPSHHGLPRFSVAMPMGEGERMTLTTGLNPVHLNGGAAADLDGAGILARADAVGSAHLGLVGTESWAVGYSMPLSAGITLSVAALNGDQADRPTEWRVDIDPFQEFSRADVTGFTARAEMALGTAKLAVQSGHVREARTVLGSASEGALSLGSGAATSFAGLSFEVPLAAGIAAFGGAEVGLSDVSAQAGSLVTGLSGVTTSSFHMGIAADEVFADGDRLGLVVSQPLRVEGGRVDLNRPVARDMVGNVLYDASSHSLVPDGREIDVQLGYATSLDSGATLAMSGMMRMQPDNVRDAAPEGVFMASYRTRF